MKISILISVALLLVASCLASRADAGGIEVKLGATIERTWQQVKADNYAYGPKQEFAAASGETHIYLSYGDKPELYDEVRGALTNVSAKSLAMFHSSNGESNAVLSYKLHFDRRIGAMRFKAGWAEIGLAANTVAGAEYSEDGLTWKTVREIKGSDKPASPIEPLVADFKASDLNTDTLFIRLYTRDPAHPDIWRRSALRGLARSGGWRLWIRLSDDDNAVELLQCGWKCFRACRATDGSTTTVTADAEQLLPRLH